MNETEMNRLPSKLGDSIFMWNAAKMYGGMRVTVNNATYPSTFSEVSKLFPDTHIVAVSGGKMQPNQLPKGYHNFKWLRDGLKITQLMDYLGDSDYITTQFSAADPSRSVMVNVKDYWDGMVVPLDGSKLPIKELMELQRRAAFHIGADSGCIWTAASVGCPVKIKYVSNPQPHHYKFTRELLERYGKVDFI